MTNVVQVVKARADPLDSAAADPSRWVREAKRGMTRDTMGDAVSEMGDGMERSCRCVRVGVGWAHVGEGRHGKGKVRKRIGKGFVEDFTR